MSPDHIPLAWLAGQPKTPPLSKEARRVAGFLLRRLQSGAAIEMPASRPMPSVGPRCHELRIPDGPVDWRFIYRIDEDAILIVEIFAKKTQKTPRRVVATCRKRLAAYARQARAEG